MRLVRRRRDSKRERGQGLVEFALVLPIVAMLLVSVLEVGLIYNAMQSIGYASREGARVAAAFAQGPNCTLPLNPNIPAVDAVAVGAAQRIIKSPDSGVRAPRVEQIRIFRATSTGAEDPSPAFVNVWRYGGPQAGPDVDPGTGGGNVERIDFVPAISPWDSCDRVNTGVTPESVGFTVRYTYDFVTPVGAFLNALSGGRFNVTLSETTVMALNPT